MVHGDIVAVEFSKTSNELVQISFDESGRHISFSSDASRPTVDWQIWFKITFLPIGFPKSVKPEYFEYQLFDSIQALCSYLRGVMCTHALLAGAGVGSAEATALAAAIQWVLRDGVGMLSSVIFAVRFAPYFGDYVKEWRLFADLINDVGLTLDMLSSMAPSHLYLPVLCISAMCKAACGVSAGATKLCITNHFCLSNNAADVATKENTQETAVTFIGLLLGMLFTSVFHNNVSCAWISFVLLTVLHVYCNYRAVSCLKLDSLNRSRCWLLTRQFLLSKHDDSYEGMSIAAINSKESFCHTFRVAYNGPKIGISLHKTLQSISCTAMICPKTRWMNLNQVFADEKYCIVPLRGGTLGVPLRVDATKMDELKAFFHASLLQLSDSAFGESKLAPTAVFVSDDTIRRSRIEIKKKWEEFSEVLKAQGWNLGDDGIVLNNSSEWYFQSPPPQ